MYILVTITSQGSGLTLVDFHNDVKLDNIFVNYRQGEIRFSDVQLGDLGGTYPASSKYAKEGIPVGAPMWSSPEVIMETPWNTATDIWSFGVVVCLRFRGDDLMKR